LKKFQFKLDKLLDYKSKLLENEITVLAALRSDLAAVNGRIDEMTAQTRACRSELQAAQARGGVTPSLCQMHVRYEEFLKAEIAKGKRIAAQIERRIEKQIEVIKDLRLEKKSIELLRASRLAAYRKEETKENERQIEEFVNTARMMHAMR
jgi:flagellar export protein FliJ